MNTTKPIAITKTEAAQAFIDSVEGRAKARTVSAEELVEVARQAEKRLAVLPKRMWKGTRVLYTVAGPWASSYSYAAEATSVVLVRRSADWALIEAKRVTVYPKQSETLTVSPASGNFGDMVERLIAASGLAIDGIDTNLLNAISNAQRLFPQANLYVMASMAAAHHFAFTRDLPITEAWVAALPEMSPSEIVALTEHFRDRVNPAELDKDTIEAMMHLRGDSEVALPDLWDALLGVSRRAA